MLRLVLVTFSLSLPVAGTGAAPAMAQEAQASDLLEALGYETYAAHLEGLYRAPPDDPAMEPHQRQNWAKAAAGLFDSDDILAAAGRALGNLDPAEAAALEAFYDSDLGRRVTAMEVAVQDPSRAAEIETAVETFGETLDDLPKARQALIMALESAFGTTDDTVAQVMNFQIGLMRGMAESGAGMITLSEEEILLQVQANAELIRRQIEAEAGFWAGYTYRALTDAEFADYVDFLNTDPARKLYGLTDAAVLEIVERDAYRLGQIYALLETSEEL